MKAKLTNRAEAAGPVPANPCYRWAILGLVWLLYANFGLIARSIAPLITPVLHDLRMTYSQMGFILGAWQLTYIFAAITAGALLDKWGARKALFAGTIIISFSAMLRYFPTEWIGMLLAVAVFGIGGPLISIGSPKTIAQLFNKKERGLAVGIYTTAPMVGGLAALSLTNSVVMPLAGGSWRLTFLLYGLVAFFSAWTWLVFTNERYLKASFGGGASFGLVFMKLIRLRKIKLILLMGLLAFLIIHGLSNWLPNILEVSGLSPEQAGYAAALPTLVGIVAILLLPHYIPAALRADAVAILSLLAGLSVVLIVESGGFLFLAGLIIFGIAAMPLFTILILLLIDSPEVGAQHIGAAGGIYFCFAEVGGFSGPFIIGALVDIFGTFTAGAIFLAFAMLLMFFSALLLKRAG